MSQELQTSIVDSKNIDWSLFKDERKDENQEMARLLILDTLENLQNNPVRYGRKFEIIIPERDFQVKTEEDFEEQANKYGGFLADWVFLALQWAQLISNGVTWEKLCNQPDTSKWHRVVWWKNGYLRIVGGLSNDKLVNAAPMTEVFSKNFDWYDEIYASVPLVVRYLTDENGRDT